MTHLSDGELHGWLDGGVSGSEAESIRHHLETCPDCAARLEEARRLRDEAAAILASAGPEGETPSFETMQRRARAPSSGTRSRWGSVQRLGWAASLVLALGAGWMARALLVERGWTDPFHQGAPAEVALRAQVEPVPESTAATAELRQKADRDAEQGAANGATREDRAEIVGGERREIEAERVTPPPEAEKYAAPPAGAMAARDRAAEQVIPGWHDLPPARTASVAEEAPGCYRLEYSWPPGVGYLPGDLELTEDPAPLRPGSAVFAVIARSGAVARLHEGIWGALSGDSLWVQLTTEPERETLTLRLERADTGWTGEGRVRDSTGRQGEDRGPVRLVRISCDIP